MNVRHKVLVVGRIHPSGMAILRAREGLNIESIEDPAVVLPEAALQDVDAVLIRYGVLTPAHVARAPRLRVVSRHGVGVDNLPLPLLSERRIPVTVVGPVNAVSVAEQAFAMLLALARCIGPYDRAVRDGRWGIRESLAVAELAGRRLLLLGLGRIGSELARRALAFDMHVWAYDPAVADTAMAAQGVQRIEDWRSRLGEVDVLSLHLPLTGSTQHLVDAGVLGALKPTAIVINTARGGLVDEAALVHALGGHLARGGACIDTFEQEPLPATHPPLALPTVIVSPHSAALSAEAAERMSVVAARNVVAGLDGTVDPALLVNRAALGR